MGGQSAGQRNTTLLQRVVKPIALVIKLKTGIASSSLPMHVREACPEGLLVVVCSECLRVK